MIYDESHWGFIRRWTFGRPMSDFKTETNPSRRRGSENIYFNIFSIVNWMKLGSKIITFCNRGWPLLGYQCNLSRKGNEFVLCVPCLILNCATPWFLWVAEVICQMCRHLCKNKSFWTYMLITNQSASIRAKQRKDYEENAFQWSSWVLLIVSDIPKTH